MRLLRYIAKICRRNGEGPQRLQCPRCRDWSVILLILETGNEALVTRGRISLAEGLAEGHIPYSRQLTEYLYTCLKCLRCVSICPSSVQFDMIMSALQHYLAAAE